MVIICHKTKISSHIFYSSFYWDMDMMMSFITTRKLAIQSISAAAAAASHPFWSACTTTIINPSTPPSSLGEEIRLVQEHRKSLRPEARDQHITGLRELSAIYQRNAHLHFHFSKFVIFQVPDSTGILSFDADNLTPNLPCLETEIMLQMNRGKCMLQSPRSNRLTYILN